MQSISEIAPGTPGQIPHFGDHFDTMLNIKWQQGY